MKHSPITPLDPAYDALLRTINTPEALAWDHERTEHTISSYCMRGGHARLAERIRAGLDDSSRIPYVIPCGGLLFNFHTHAKHPRGQWRVTTLDRYCAPETPSTWEILLDLDALAETDNTSWVWHGAKLLDENPHAFTASHASPHAPARALLFLSPGGGDAIVVREFDIPSRSFVSQDEGGFFIPLAKTNVSWEDENTLLVGTDYGPGSLTESGYARCIRRWKRGTHLADAPTIFEGKSTDISVQAWADTAPDAHALYVLRAPTMFTAELYVDYGEKNQPDDEPSFHRLDVPDDCEVLCTPAHIIFMPRTQWSSLPPGSVGIAELHAFADSGAEAITPLFIPSPSEACMNVTTTRNYVVIEVLHDVETSIRVHALDEPTRMFMLPVPESSATSVVATSPRTSDEVWITSRSFIQPPALTRVDVALYEKNGIFPDPIKKQPPLFDATHLETRKHFALSKDGTRIPYFITGNFAEHLPRPTLVYAYGGFEVSLLPDYSLIRGIGWLEKDNYFVQACLRGGGEYGPAWHEAGLKEKRLTIYDDHEAVLRDVVARGYATTAQLGVHGRSNGGLLSAVALTRYPELCGAVVSDVPLTDMLEFHHMLAGASWIGEYGDPDDHEHPEQRKVLETYSPFHNVAHHNARPYPPCLITTSTCDDRVHPGHARLFTAALEAAGQPVDYYCNPEGGHAGAATNEQVAFRAALLYSWLTAHLSNA